MTGAAAAVTALLVVHAWAADRADTPAHPAYGLGLKAPRTVSPQDNGVGAPLLPQPATTFYLGERNMPRFGAQESESFGGISRPFAGRWASSVEASVTRETVLVAPRHSLSGRIERRLAPGESVSLGLKLTSRDRSGRPAVAPGLLGTPGNEQSFALGYELNMSYSYGNGNRVGMYYQLAPLHAGYNGFVPGAGNNAFMLSSEHRLSPKWALSYDISGAEPGAVLRSPSVGLGLRYRF